MEIIETTYIVDAVACRVGQPATVARLQHDDDVRRLYDNILASGYYDTAYFERQTGYQEHALTVNLWFVAAMVRALRPQRSLEIGAGKGDVVEILRRAGIDAWGLDFSEDMYEQLSPVVRDAYHFGDALEACRRLRNDEERFDTVIGLDIWEHLLPETLAPTIRETVGLLADDGMSVSVIPAFGPDRVFGEVFPLEFEENRPRLDAGEPFDHITLEQTDPPLPAAGHLTWAPASWWERQFTDAGLVREERIERRLHAVFDRYLPPSNRSFFVLRRDTAAARARADDVERSLRSPAPLRRAVELGRLARAEVGGSHRFAVSPLEYVADRAPHLRPLELTVRMAKRAAGRLGR